jgi:integrase
MRHTAATLMLLQDVPHKVVMHRMGWTTMAMVDRYQHLLPQMDDKAAAELDKLFP